MRRNNGRREQLGELPPQHYRAGRRNNAGAGMIPEWINNFTATNFPFVTDGTSQQIIPSNPLRAYLLIQNKDAVNDMVINFSNDATLFNGIIIIPRGNWEIIGGANGGSFVPQDSINILGAAAGMAGVVVEGVLPPVIPGN